MHCVTRCCRRVEIASPPSHPHPTRPGPRLAVNRPAVTDERTPKTRTTTGTETDKSGEIKAIALAISVINRSRTRISSCPCVHVFGRVRAWKSACESSFVNVCV